MASAAIVRNLTILVAHLFSAAPASSIVRSPIISSSNQV
jgi:hypothetical protein